MARGARQNAALDKSDLLIDLLAFQLAGRMGHRSAFGLRTEDVPIRPATETGYTLDARLTTPVESPKDPWGSDLAKGFRAFRAKGAEHVRAELIRHLAALLTTGDEKLGALIDKEARASTRAVWTPTVENFFARVTSAYLAALWIELLGLRPDHPTITTFEKLKKAEKAAKLEALLAGQDGLELPAERRARIAAWLPEGMA